MMANYSHVTGNVLMSTRLSMVIKMEHQTLKELENWCMRHHKSVVIHAGKICGFNPEEIFIFASHNGELKWCPKCREYTEQTMVGDHRIAVSIYCKKCSELVGEQ